MTGPFNPLDKINLGESVASAILRQPVVELPPPRPFNGAGIYAIYYTGDHEEYGRVRELNSDGRFGWPIYVGKAIPKGGRRGGVGHTDDVGPVMYKRIQEHADSIEKAENLRRADFQCRHLVVDDIWMPLGESLLIQKFQPIWNTFLDGFGNHDPGGGRYNQQRSPWDMVHPGRPWASRCAENAKTVDQILAGLRAAIKDTMKKLQLPDSSGA